MTNTNATRIRTARFTNGTTRWSVTLYDLGTYDARGCTALGWRVTENGKLVAWDMTPAGAVYGSPPHADDSDATMAAACSLIAHCASHDSDDKPITADWDANGLAEAAAMRWSDL